MHAQEAGVATVQAQLAFYLTVAQGLMLPNFRLQLPNSVHLR